MLFTVTEDIPNIDIVIYIDCWDGDFLNQPNTQGTESLYERITNFVFKLRPVPKFHVVSLNGFNYPFSSLISKVLFNNDNHAYLDRVKCLEQTLTGRNLHNCNVLVTGAVWQQCLHYRELGFINLLKNTNLNIYTHRDVIKLRWEEKTNPNGDAYIEDTMFGNDHLIWHKLPGGYYKLTRTGNDK